MIARLAPLALAGTLALSGVSHAADTTLAATDTYLAVTGASADAVTPRAGNAATVELAPHEARIFDFGAGSALVYYMLDQGRTELAHVTTIVVLNSDESTAPVRFVTHLAAGQKAEVSLADPDAAPASLDFAYEGGLVTVRPVTAAQSDG